MSAEVDHWMEEVAKARDREHAARIASDAAEEELMLAGKNLREAENALQAQLDIDIEGIRKAA